LGLAGSLLLYFALATVIAEAMILGYCWSKWRLDRNKLLQIAAVAQGVDLVGLKAEPKPAQDDAPGEQPSYQQIVQARALKLRNLELREQSLKNGVDQLLAEQLAFADDKTRLQKQRREYESQLAVLAKDSESAGVEQTRGILAKLAPKQAKELLLGMLKKNELPSVVTLLSDMSDSSRAKILKEFKTPEETEKLDEVLRQIRLGMPQSAIARKAQDQLKPETPPKPSGL
jgi:hypothetical protein